MILSVLFLTTLIPTRVEIPAIAHFGGFVLGRDTTESLDSRIGQGAVLVGGHSNSARAWHSGDLSIWTDGFEVNRQGNVCIVDQFKMAWSRDSRAPAIQGNLFRRRSISPLSIDSIGETESAVIERLKDFHIKPVREDDNSLSISQKGTLRANEFVVFDIWTADLTFSKGKLASVELSCDYANK